MKTFFKCILYGLFADKIVFVSHQNAYIYVSMTCNGKFTIHIFDLDLDSIIDFDDKKYNTFKEAKQAAIKEGEELFSRIEKNNLI